MNAAAAPPPPAPGSPRQLFWACSAIALQGFGGVLAVVQRELVDRRGWLTREQFVEDWAVAQTLPGPNVVNLALMLGDRHFGWRGAFAAVAGLLLFPLVLLLALALGFEGLAEVPAAQGALRGMAAVAAGLVAGTALKLLVALRGNVLGPVACALAMAVTFGAVALLRMPLAAALPLVALPACLWAAWRLKGRK
ncbi:MAG: chromate transporter [Rubrivivax sp.]|nr:chromate transporter [Rubrivivax sp.]